MASKTAIEFHQPEEISLMDRTELLDIALRIAEAVGRTTEPRDSASGSMNSEGEVIGSVPLHLQHLHNLLDDMTVDALAALFDFRLKAKLVDAVRTIFFESLRTHVSEPENSNGIIVQPNWDVVANWRSDKVNEAGDDISALMSIMSTLMAADR